MTDQARTPVGRLTVEIQSFENRTTHTQLREGARHFGEGKKTTAPAKGAAAAPSAFAILFIQFLERGVVLEIPPQSCAKGHRIELQFDVSTGGAKFPFKAVGEVLEVESAVGERDSVTLKFMSFDAEAWARIQQLYASRQADVASFFDRLKGED